MCFGLNCFVSSDTGYLKTKVLGVQSVKYHVKQDFKSVRMFFCYSLLS